jgi:hypothetical protein
MYRDGPGPSIGRLLRRATAAEPDHVGEIDDSPTLQFACLSATHEQQATQGSGIIRDHNAAERGYEAGA